MSMKQHLVWSGCPTQNHSPLFDVIKDVLVRCSLPIASCIGQAYDGAANTSGVRNGVKALTKKEAEHCLYVHCFAHSLNLCVQEVTKNCELLGNCMKFIFQLVKPSQNFHPRG